MKFTKAQRAKRWPCVDSPASFASTATPLLINEVLGVRVNPQDRHNVGWIDAFNVPIGPFSSATETTRTLE